MATISFYSNESYTLQIDKCSLEWINKEKDRAAHVPQWQFFLKFYGWGLHDFFSVGKLQIWS